MITGELKSHITHTKVKGSAPLSLIITLKNTPFYSIENYALSQSYQRFLADFNCVQPCENVLCSDGAFFV